jgi:hypothetical protein
LQLFPVLCEPGDEAVRFGLKDKTVSDTDAYTVDAANRPENALKSISPDAMEWSR